MGPESFGSILSDLLALIDFSTKSLDSSLIAPGMALINGDGFHHL
jgi:hypothetical protein